MTNFTKFVLKFHTHVLCFVDNDAFVHFVLDCMFHAHNILAFAPYSVKENIPNKLFT